MKGLELLSKVALSFQNWDDFDHDMQQVLKNIGSFTDVSRIYIIFNEADKMMKNTFEWCNKGVLPQIQPLQKFLYEDMPSLYPLVIEKGYLYSDDIRNLPKDIIDILAPQKIKSIFLYPLIINNKIKGFIGFDECKYIRKWKTEELEILSTVSGIITNAYQRKALQEQTLDLERFFSVSLDLFCITDGKGHLLKTNKSWQDILGYSSEELNGRKFFDFIHPKDRLSTEKYLQQLNNNQEVSNLINRYISSSGNYHYLEWRAILHKGGIYATARDVTERMAYEKKILKISNRDPLTNVYNRRYIFKKAEEIIEEYEKVGKEFSLCILDIDHFKKINDTYGHQMGDYILRKLTSTITESLRPHDLLGRYGGEEFIIIFKNTNKDKSSLAVQNILNIIRQRTFVFNGKAIQFTFSAGVAHCNEIENDGKIMDSLVKIADQRMYYAKKIGRNKIVSEIVV